MIVAKISEFYCGGCSKTYNKFYRLDGPLPTCELCYCEMELRSSGKKTYFPFTPYHNKQLDKYFATADEERSYVKKNGLADITGEHDAWRSGRGGWKNKTT